MNHSVSIPLDIVLERRNVQGQGWTVSQWDAVFALGRPEPTCPDPKPQSGGPKVARSGNELYVWQGLRLNLYRDSAECYRHNLSSDHPSLYVICHEGEDEMIQPLTVTADGLEASAANEGDDRVCRVDIPPDVYLTIERFVVEHCVGQRRKKRRREDWNRDPE